MLGLTVQTPNEARIPIIILKKRKKKHSSAIITSTLSQGYSLVFLRFKANVERRIKKAKKKKKEKGTLLLNKARKSLRVKYQKQSNF